MNRSLSSYLNLLRFLAALAVYVSHAGYFTKLRIPYVGNMGSEAVFVFFVLSGMLITFSGMKQPDGYAFLRARLIRLWSVCLPALVLTMVWDTIGQAISLDAYSPMQPYNIFKWVASIGLNALFLNQVWHANIYPGTNGPFWSLSYEFWYYMIFAAGVYFSGKKKYIAIACAAAIAGPDILVGLPIWLLGSAVHFAVARRGASAWVGWTFWLGSIVAALAFSAFNAGLVLVETFPGIAAGAKWKVGFWPASYLIGVLVAINIYGFSLIADRFQAVLNRFAWPIQVGADISFGLYLFHYPLMYFVKAILYGAKLTSGPVFVAAIYVVPFLIAAWLAILCERHKGWIGKLIDRVGNVARPGWSKPAKNDVALRLDDLLLPPQPSASVAADEERLSG